MLVLEPVGNILCVTLIGAALCLRDLSCKSGCLLTLLKQTKCKGWTNRSSELLRDLQDVAFAMTAYEDTTASSAMLESSYDVTAE